MIKLRRIDSFSYPCNEKTADPKGQPFLVFLIHSDEFGRFLFNDDFFRNSAFSGGSDKEVYARSVMLQSIMQVLGT